MEDEEEEGGADDDDNADGDDGVGQLSITEPL